MSTPLVNPILNPAMGKMIRNYINPSSLWVMVDVEANGPCPGLYSMTELGVIVVEPNLDRTFYAQLRPLDDSGVQPEALASIGRTMGQTMAYPPAEEGMTAFGEWLTEISQPGPVGRPLRLMFVSDNNGFDWGYVNYYCWRFLGKNPFGHSSTNLGSLWKGYRRDFYSSFKFLRRTKHTHHPVDDARGNAEAMLTMLEQWRELGGPLR